MSSGRFCYLCGRKTEELLEGLCHTCYSGEKELVTLPDRLSAGICRECGTIIDGKKGSHYYCDMHDLVRGIAHDEVEKNLKHDLKDLELEVEVKNEIDTGKLIKAELEVKVKSPLKGHVYERTFYPHIKIKRGLCNVCNLKLGGYYEALIQLRGDNLEESFKEAISYLEANSGDPMAYISEIGNVKGGIDIKIGGQRAAKALANHLKNSFNSQIKETVSLVGRKEGKDIFRKTFLIRT